ncbi:unnamed protein product [Nesidiocoris tenuis]|uniref:Uncharacterized protein n=1 Tax=Nesidiocoris tenuis TaxID=355587 RepID=A0A6H5HB96_9HEMI|nr:unnamed protein product [Nesidiocoris tenuis]
MSKRGGDQDQTCASCRNEEGIKTRPELHARTRRGSRPDVSFTSGRGGDQDQTNRKNRVRNLKFYKEFKISVEPPEIDVKLAGFLGAVRTFIVAGACEWTGQTACRIIIRSLVAEDCAKELIIFFK